MCSLVIAKGALLGQQGMGSMMLHHSLYLIRSIGSIRKNRHVLASHVWLFGDAGNPPDQVLVGLDIILRCDGYALYDGGTATVVVTHHGNATRS